MPVSGGGSPVLPGSPGSAAPGLPGFTDPVATFLAAAGRLAAAAVERGDRAEARRVLEDALRALEANVGSTPAPPALRVLR